MEVDRLIKAASKVGRHHHRDSSIILVAYRHSLRISEFVALQWNVVELDQERMHISRVKDGLPSVHPIRGPEIRALRRLKREYPSSPYVFVTERKGPLTASAVRKIIARDGISRFIRTCFATQQATSLPTMATTLVLSSSI